LLVPLDKMVPLDQMVEMVLMVLLVLKELLEKLVLVATKDSLDLLANPVLLVNLAKMDQLENLVIPDLPVALVLMDLPVLLVNQVHKDSKVNPDSQGPLDPLVRMVTEVLKDLLVTKVHLAHPDLLLLLIYFLVNPCTRDPAQ
jgi:hypothetical protein